MKTELTTQKIRTGKYLLTASNGSQFEAVCSPDEYGEPGWKLYRLPITKNPGSFRTLKDCKRIALQWANH